MIECHRKFLGYILLILSLIKYITGLPPRVTIGALFEEELKDSELELAFKYAVHRVNHDRELLPDTKLIYDIQYIPTEDSFRTYRKACEQLDYGIVAVFGPQDPLLSSHISSICDALEIPHIEARWDFEPQYKSYSINLYPEFSLLSQAFLDLMRFWNWTRVGIIYEDHYGLIKLQDVINSPLTEHIDLYIRQASHNDYREVLRELRRLKIFKIIIDNGKTDLQIVFRQILQVQMNDHKYQYIFTTFNFETYDLEDLKHNMVNMTTFRLVDSETILIQNIIKDMERFQPTGSNIYNKTNIIKVLSKDVDRLTSSEVGHSNKSLIMKAEPALMYDAVMVFAKGLQAFDKASQLKPGNVSCSDETSWSLGSSFLNYLNMIDHKGLTGNITFVEGQRKTFKLDIVKLKENAIIKIGTWDSETGVNITKDKNVIDEDIGTNLTLHVTTLLNKPLVVTTMPEKPYVMIKKEAKEKGLIGNDQFEGFCIDMLQLIAQKVGFKYKLQLVSDNTYGVPDEKKKWNGMIKELIDGTADLAVASLTINYVREEVIDFTKPFMTLGISILFKIPKGAPPGLFSFLNPLSIEIWIYVLAAYIAVSFTMFILARFSPYEWYNPHPCNSHTDVVENQFTLANSFWFTIGTLMQQGSDINPRAVSTRIVGGIWWFFTLIIISSYTANLAAFLTVERMTSPIQNADDLASQSEIAYGTISGGSTMTFFKESQIETYQKMWRYMESKKSSVFVSSYEEGIEKVRKGNYAFLMESTMIDYVTQRDCNLTQIGGQLDSKGYGIGTPMDSPWRDKISLAILELQETGKIPMLKNKWWKHMGANCDRDDKPKDSKANSLGVGNVGGVFVVLLCGLAFAIIVAIMEFIWNSRRNAETDRVRGCISQSICSEMAEELRFAIRCRGSRQRPALKRQCSKCVPGTTYVPANLDSNTHENGIMQMIELRKSPIHFDVHSHHSHSADV